MKYIFMILLLSLSSQWCAAQDDDRAAVEQVLWTMVEGMRSGDSSIVRPLFTADAEFFSVYTTGKGKRMVKPGSVDQWITAIGTPHDEVWNEELWDMQINIDGVLAHVWVPYAFYLGNTFSHCGVDSFHLAKGDDDQWRIFHASDTRRRSDCASFIPDTIKAKYD